MHFKLIIALVADEKTEAVIAAAKAEGATGASVVNNTRGEGLMMKKTFLGLELDTPRNMILFLVEEHLGRNVLETIGEVAELDKVSGAGIAFMVDVEDAIGLSGQIDKITERVEDEL
ncbi:MAG: transcriptional regulator [Thiothrix nivea]|nr:MAG: transcriptional regulator [Thiothrix nivea]